MLPGEIVASRKELRPWGWNDTFYHRLFNSVSFRQQDFSGRNKEPKIMRPFLFFFICVFLLGGVVSLRAEVIDRVVAVVNDDVITLSEMQAEGRDFFEQVSQQAPAAERAAALQKARQEVLDSLVDKMITAQKAAEMGISVSESEVDEAINRLLTEQKIGSDALMKVLQARGISEEQYRSSIREQILRSKLVSYEVSSKIVITEEQSRAYYAEKYTAEVSEGGFYLLQMGFAWQEKGDDSETARKEAKERAQRAWNRAAAGDDFKELARTLSELPSAVDGGDIGVLKVAEMSTTMRETISRLQPGEVSSILETPSGYQFFKLLSRQQGETIQKSPYESVKSEIQDALYRQEMERQYGRWIQELRGRAYIKEML